MKKDKQWQDLVIELKHQDNIVLVEGIKDKRAIEGLGVKNIALVKNRPLYKVIDEVTEFKKAVILTDLDREGKKLFSILNHELKQKGVCINNDVRNFLYKETKLRQIEGLTRYMSKNGYVEGWFI